MVKSRLVNHVIFLAGALLLGALFVGAPWRHSPSSPLLDAGVARLELSTTDLDLGDGEPGELMRGTFSLSNTGSIPLEFHLTASCGCTELTPREGTIAPNTAAAIQVGLKLQAIPNAERTARVSVEFNGNQRYPLVCMVKAKCPAPVRVSPSSVSLEILLGHPRTMEAVLDIHNPNGEPWTAGDRLAVASSSPRVLGWLFANDVGHVQLAVGIKQDEDGVDSDIHGTLTLKVDDSDLTVAVPVHARVVPPVRVAPSTITLTCDLTTGEYRERQILVWSSGRTPVGNLESVSGPHGVSVTELDSEDSPAHRRRLVLRAANDVDLEESVSLALTFSGQNNPVTITIRQERKSLATSPSIQEELR